MSPLRQALAARLDQDPDWQLLKRAQAQPTPEEEAARWTDPKHIGKERAEQAMEQYARKEPGYDEQANALEKQLIDLNTQIGRLPKNDTRRLPLVQQVKAVEAKQHARRMELAAPAVSDPGLWAELQRSAENRAERILKYPAGSSARRGAYVGQTLGMSGEALGRGARALGGWAAAPFTGFWTGLTGKPVEDIENPLAKSQRIRAEEYPAAARLAGSTQAKAEKDYAGAEEREAMWRKYLGLGTPPIYEPKAQTPYVTTPPTPSTWAPGQVTPPKATPAKPARPVVPGGPGVRGGVRKQPQPQG